MIKSLESGDISRVQRLSQLQLFICFELLVVTATPVLTGGTNIPVHVSLVERKKREAQVGIGGNVDSGLVSSYVSLDFSHIDLGNRLLFGNDQSSWVCNFSCTGYGGYSKGPHLDNQVTVFIRVLSNLFGLLDLKLPTNWVSNRHIDFPLRRLLHTGRGSSPLILSDFHLWMPSCHTITPGFNT